MTHDRIPGEGSRASRDVGRAERRAARRLPLLRSLDARLSRFVPVRVVDVSLGGIRVESGTRLVPRMPVEVTIEFPAGPFEVWATVRRSRMAVGREAGGRVVVTYTAGLEFAEVDERTLAALSCFILRPPAHPFQAAQAKPAEAPPPASEVPPPARHARSRGPTRIRVATVHLRPAGGRPD
jgi:hypothetical protein